MLKDLNSPAGFSFLLTGFICESLQICDMVTIARYLNLTLLIPDLDKRSFWADPRFVHYW